MAGNSGPEETNIMDIQALRARLNLYVIVPLIEDLVAHDPEAAALVQGWNCVVEICAGADPELCIQFSFENGAVTALPGRERKAILALDFGDAAGINDAFRGGSKKPRVRGAWHIIILIRFGKLLARLSRYLKPRDEAAMDAAALELRARMLLRVGVLGLPEIAANHEEAAPMAAKLPDGSCAWRILPDGPVVHAVIAGGKITADIGALPQPDATVNFKNKEAALGVLTGRVEGMAALTSGDLMISGKTQIPLMLTQFQDKIGKTLD